MDVGLLENVEARFATGWPVWPVLDSHVLDGVRLEASVRFIGTAEHGAQIGMCLEANPMRVALANVSLHFVLA